MEVHAVSGGWVLEWSGFTGSSIVKATVGVAGFLVVASGVVQGVRHRPFRWNSHKGRLARDNIKEHDAAGSNQVMKELEGEIGSASQAPDNQQVAMATARASDLPPLDVSGVDSPRSRIGRGLESIGGMTADTLQRFSTAVGGVVKSPVVLMAKVGGLASPRAATLTAPPGSSLEERVFHLENQMKSFEEKFSSRTVVTELDLLPRSHNEKPRIAKSLLQEMETEGTSVKHVQMLERMERIEKALSSIQSQLDHLEFSRRESVAGYEREESLSGEPQYYDAEQSENFEALETLEQNSFDAHDVPGEATGGSPTLEKSRVKEASSAAPTTAEHVEPLQDIDAGKNDDFLEPQVVSTSVNSREAFLTQPMKSATPSSELADSVHRDGDGNLPASSDQQLASTLKELHGSFMTESSAAAASAKFLEVARADTADKSTLARTSLEPQSASASVFKEPREAVMEESAVAVPVAKSEEHAQEDAADESGTTIAAAESLSPPTFEATQKDFMNEPLAAAPNTQPAQELATQEDGDIALASFEPRVTAVEEPSMAVPSANSEEPPLEDIGDKSVTMTAAKESPKAFEFQDPHEDFVKESLASALGAGQAHKPSSQEDSSISSDMALASFESLVASKSVEEPSTATPNSNFEEPAQEDDVDKSSNAIGAVELPLASSLEEPQEESTKEFMAAAPSVESAQVLATQEDNDVQVATPKSQMASNFVEESSLATPSTDFDEPKFQMASNLVEEPFAIAPSIEFEELAQEDVAEKIGTTMATTESSLEEPKEGFDKESMASTPSGELAQEHIYMAVASSETEGASKFVEEPSLDLPSANSKELAHDEDVVKSDALSVGADRPLASSFEEPQEDFKKESLATTSNCEPTQGLAMEEDSHMAPTTFESQEASKSMEEPSTTVPSVDFEEPKHEDVVDKSVAMTAGGVSPFTSSFEGPQEGFEMGSLVESKHGHDEADQNSLEDVKIIAEPIEEAIPRSQSDLTHDKLKFEVAKDSRELESQGSFLAFGATSVDFKEDLVKEPLPSTKLSKLFEEENNIGKRGPVLADSTMEEPQKPLAKESLSSAKLELEDHARRGFARSSSEPQLAYKLEEHRKALVKESSVVVVPSASKLGEEHAQEDFGGTQCLPFRILGEGKHPRKESDFKLVEDLKSPAMKSDTTSSYVLEPKPSKIKEKKKKEKKERKPDATVEEKERRLSLELGELERKSSLRAEEKHKQPFKHFRDRLRHAFSVNKEP